MRNRGIDCAHRNALYARTSGRKPKASLETRSCSGRHAETMQSTTCSMMGSSWIRAEAQVRGMWSENSPERARTHWDTSSPWKRSQCEQRWRKKSSSAPDPPEFRPSSARKTEFLPQFCLRLSRMARPCPQRMATAVATAVGGEHSLIRICWYAAAGRAAREG